MVCTKDATRVEAIRLMRLAVRQGHGVMSFDMGLDSVKQLASNWLKTSGYITVKDVVISPRYHSWTQRTITVTDAGWVAAGRLDGMEDKASYISHLAEGGPETAGEWFTRVHNPAGYAAIHGVG